MATLYELVREAGFVDVPFERVGGTSVGEVDSCGGEETLICDDRLEH
jgi:hypothetical protein